MNGIKRMLLSCALFFALLPFGCYSASADGPQITMPQTQWETLKEAWRMQENDLTMLEIKLNELKKNSGIQSEALNELQNQLEESKKQLKTTKESLTKVTRSLNEARNDLEKSKIYLEILKQEIKQMEHKERVIRRQRNAWAVVATVTVGAAILGR